MSEETTVENATINDTEAIEEPEAIEHEDAGNEEDVEARQDDERFEEIVGEQKREINMLREHDEHVRSIAARASKLRNDWLSAKETASSRKKAYEACLEELQDECLNRPTFGPLFEEQAADDAEEHAVPDDELPQEDDGISNLPWRYQPIEMLDLTEYEIDKLNDLESDDFGTLGEIADFLAENKLASEYLCFSDDDEARIRTAVQEFITNETQTNTDEAGEADSSDPLDPTD